MTFEEPDKIITRRANTCSYDQITVRNGAVLETIFVLQQNKNHTMTVKEFIAAKESRRCRLLVRGAEHSPRCPLTKLFGSKHPTKTWLAATEECSMWIEAVIQTSARANTR